jgi:parallel beta-helix repeat protein
MSPVTWASRANANGLPRSMRLRRRLAIAGPWIVLMLTPMGVDTSARASVIRRMEPTQVAGAVIRMKSVCSEYASTSGNDNARGGRYRPYRTVGKLLSRLSPGQTGCLLGGTFTEDVTVRRGGQIGRRIVLRSAPGLWATLRGRLWIADSANYVTFEFLNLDGRNQAHLPSPTINGDWVTFRGNNVTNHRDGTGPVSGHGICFSLGFPGYGASIHTQIERNRIHDCGISDNHNHGIYLVLARRTFISDNYIYDNGDRGIQLYPDADGTMIEHNVIDGNGQGIIFSGDSSGVSENNVARWNIISNSIVRWNVESWYPTGIHPGVGNVVSSNCLFASNARRYYDSNGGVSDQVGFVASGNVVANPLYVDRARRDFVLRPKSPCHGYGPQAAA